MRKSRASLQSGQSLLFDAKIGAWLLFLYKDFKHLTYACGGADQFESHQVIKFRRHV